MKSLVVDDELTSRMLLEEILFRFGEVHSCGDGTEAVRACETALEAGCPFDLICLDLFMPIMGGLDALNLIRRVEQSHGRVRPHASKVIIATADDDGDSVRKAFTELCDAYIVKPIDPAEILNLVYCLCPVAEGDPAA